jgi:hypothetical protein
LACYIQQNSFTPSSDNPEILKDSSLHIILNTFYQTKASSMKQPDLRDMFQTALNTACFQLLWDHLTSCLDPDDPEPANKGDIHMEYSLIRCASQAKYKRMTDNYRS